MQENENEKKKIGFFGKIKNILFVDDETVDEKDTPVLPDYKNKQEEVKEEPVEEKEEPQVIGSRLNNERKEVVFAEEPVLEEIKEEVIVEEVKEEKESPFFSFDEDEFKRLTSRVARSEAGNKENDNISKPAIKNNYYNTGSSKYENKSSTLSSVSNTAHPGRKPFVPSPVISPVYGILDKNYSKEDIVDRRTERKSKDIDTLDRVRTKAFGNTKATEVKEEDGPIEVKEEKVEIGERVFPTIDELPKRDDRPVTVREERKKVEDVENNIDIEIPTLDSKIIDVIEKEVTSPIEEEVTSPIEEELNNIINNDIEDELVDVEESNGTRKSAKLDDLEKTSTLKILDDIEKELNSIKPVTSENKDDEELEKDNQTVEKDIFDMISSMYEGGDEEDDSD